MKIIIVILTILTASCSVIGAYTENPLDTQVNFYLQSTNGHAYLKKQTDLKMAKTGLVSGNTLIYSASGGSSKLLGNNKQRNVVYPLWINESEVVEVEYAIGKYRQWQKQTRPLSFTAVQPINQYVSKWMNGVTFKFGLLNDNEGKRFIQVCYEFTELSSCTFTYLIDEQNIDFLYDDLQAFKQHRYIYVS